MRMFARMNPSGSGRDITVKKSLRAAERKRADVARARRRWIREQGFLDPTHLVFIDETAVTTDMMRLNGWNPRGKRLVSDAPMGHWETVTFIAGLRLRTFVNRRWTEYTGLSAEDTVGSGWKTAIHPEDFERWLKLWRACFACPRDNDSALRVQGRAPDQGRPNHHQDEYRVAEWHEVGESGLIGASTVGDRLGVPASTAWHLIPRVLPP
jgi:PAS domain-containing protein